MATKLNEKQLLKLQNEIIEDERLKAKVEARLKLNKLTLAEEIEEGTTLEGAFGWKFTHKAGSTRITLDSKKLKEEQPEIYAQYAKESKTSASLSVIAPRVK